MNICYRYVDFGTTFSKKPGSRSDANRDPTALFDNELAVDVGSVCWGVDGEERSILDHHFPRDRDQFPSASAAVLHNAHRIWQRFQGRPQSDDAFWLVTHRDPDFDAFCASYLARAILHGDLPHDGWEDLGLSPDGWPGSAAENRPAIDWFAPDVRALARDQARRCAVLLASYAAVVDNCRLLSVARNRALHSVLYAAVHRGRELNDGAAAFFDEARRAVAGGLNPFYDSLFEESGTFAPELSMLDLQVEAYQRDIRRARQAVVSVPAGDVAFTRWYSTLTRELAPGETTGTEERLVDGLVMRPHHGLPSQRRTQMDGIYLRDPECLLFKEWARMDTENAPARRGFSFTAVAYSSSMPDAPANTTRYIFALDPERVTGHHLYPVWALLQTEEVKAFHRPEFAQLKHRLEEAERQAAETPRGTRCRRGYETRAAGYSGLFDDPWFDGGNYGCTIVDTPGRGTLIGCSSSDLSDDAVVRLVRQELEYSCFASDISITDFSATTPSTAGREDTYTLPGVLASAPPAPAGHFRFAHIGLRPDVDVLHGVMAEQVGRLLWRLLEPGRGDGVPTDFHTRHLLVSPETVAVWSRRGAALAAKPQADSDAARLRGQFKSMADMTRGLQSLLALAGNPASTPDTTIDEADRLMRGVAELTHQFSLPENRLAERFFDATSLDDVVATIRTISLSALERRHTVRAQEQREDTRALTGSMAANTASMRENIATVARVQTILEYIEIFLISVYLAHLWHMFAGENEPLRHYVEAHLPLLAEWYLPLGVLVSAAGGALVSGWAILRGSKRHRPDNRCRSCGEDRTGTDGRKTSVDAENARGTACGTVATVCAALFRLWITRVLQGRRAPGEWRHAPVRRGRRYIANSSPMIPRMPKITAR